jgi:RNA polymerase sigma-70 factor (ECF subfamily)
VTHARPLSAAFLSAQGGAAGIGDEVADLEDVLVDALARARAAWPMIRTVTVDDATYARWLGERVAGEDLASFKVEDLLASCACVAGDATAIAAVEARTFPDVEAALGRMGLSRDRIDEVKQGLRKLVFVGDGPQALGPRIAEYRGTGDLRAWLRVTAMRAALKLIRKEGREQPSDDAVLEARSSADDPELAYMKAAYRVAFREAFQDALDSLLAKERLLLKQQIVDGLGIDELGALYKVHRATAARWAASAREKLLGRTRRSFMMRARITSDECESIMRLVRSQLDVSLHRRLAHAE